MKTLAKILAGILIVAIILFACIRIWNVEAVHIFMKVLQIAAEHGNVSAQSELGYLNYLTSLQKSPNQPAYGGNMGEAVKWWTVAANNGDVDAQYNLGAAYLKGQAGLMKDNVTALAWFYKASLQGSLSAKLAIQSLEPIMTPTQIAEAKRRSQQ